MKKLVFICSCICALLWGCAGERQGLVCEEMEYRLNTMTYSPDQRAYAEEELRVCREEEAAKKAEGAASRKSIYDRFAATDSTKTASNVPADSAKEVSVSKALQDTSSQETVSIYDRYGSKTDASSEAAPSAPSAENDAPADTSVSDVSNFQ